MQTVREEIMEKKLIVIYGKDNCPKCAELKNEVIDILSSPEYSKEFELDYQNLSTVEGMEAYATAETVNGQRIPALQIMRYSEETASYVKSEDPRPEQHSSGIYEFVPAYLQLETDYSLADPRIKPVQIKELMALARGN